MTATVARAGADTWTIARRDLLHWRRQPAAVLVGWLFPVLVLLMFSYLVGGAIEVPGDYLDYLVPGVLGLTVVFGLETTMTAVATDAASGTTDRFRSLPIARSAVVAGRCVADLLSSAVGLAVLVACCLALGWRPGGWLAGAAALLLLLRVAVLWLGIWLGLVVRGPESVVAVQILVWPLAFLSGTFVPPSSMPGWLGAVAEWNPLTATVAAVRELTGGAAAAGTSWAAQHPVLLAVVWPLALTAVFAPLAVRRYARLSR